MEKLTKYVRKFEEAKPYINKWITKFHGENRNNYEVKDFKKTTIQNLVNSEKDFLKINDVIFLKDGKNNPDTNQSLVLIKKVDNYDKDKKEIEKGIKNHLIDYSFMYNKDKKIYTFYYVF